MKLFMPTAAALTAVSFKNYSNLMLIFIRHKYPQDISVLVNSAVGKRTFTGACIHFSLIGFFFIAGEQFSHSIQHFFSSHVST